MSVESEENDNQPSYMTQDSIFEDFVDVFEGLGCLLVLIHLA